MVTKKRGTPKVAEAAPEYRAKPLSETFWLAFQELPDLDRVAFFERLIEDEELREDLLDSIVIMNRRGEPASDYKEFEKELRRDGLL